MWVCRLPVHIGPRRMRRFFTELFGEFATAQRADVGIGPYRICSNMSVRSANPWTYFPP